MAEASERHRVETPPTEAALWPSPWPAEDGGPRREQRVATEIRRSTSAAPGRDLRNVAERASTRGLELAAWRDAYATTMIVLRDPGELFALRHTIGTRPLRDPTSAWVERLDPETLAPIAASPMLPGGPLWPGGLAAHANGSLHVVHGRWCHRLSPELELLNTAELPAPRPYNGFVVLADGVLVTKDIDRDGRVPATITVLDPVTLERRCDDLLMPEPVVARLSADGDTVYAVGETTVWRLRWDAEQLVLDPDWSLRYRLASDRLQSHGWDPVIAGGQVWFLDNGRHDYAFSMRRAGRATGAVRLHRVSLDDPADHDCVPVSGLPGGAVTDPPLIDAARRIAVAYDSANGVVQAFRWESDRSRATVRRLVPAWRRKLDHAAHMILFADRGEVVLHDFHGPPVPGLPRVTRALGSRVLSPAGLAAVRRVLARLGGDDVVVLDIDSGDERGRARVPSMFQSVLFPAPGFQSDIYWCTFSTLGRLKLR